MSLGRIASYKYGIVKSIFIAVLIYIVGFTILIHAYSLQAMAKPVTDGLVGHWSFDELEGETVRDASGNNDGIIKGDLEIAGGQVDGALRFDGLDDYMDLDNGDGTVNDVIDGSSGVTVTIWVNPDEFSAVEYNNNVFTIWISSTHWGFSIHIEGADGNKARIGGRSNENDNWQDVTGTSAVPTGKWSNIAGVLDFANAKVYVYVDGELEAERDAEFGSETYTKAIAGPEVIGWYGHQNDPGRYFSGLIDEARIYNRALSKDEVQQDFAAALAVLDPNMELASTWGKIKILE